MKPALLLTLLVCSYVACCASDSQTAAKSNASVTAQEHRIPAGNTSLYSREIGNGPAIIVLHGGPDFDHLYLLPDLDRLSDSYRLIYYDQRGRGQSGNGVQPKEVSLESEIADLEKVRQYYKLDSVVLLGHSWGTVIALEYAIRYPQRVSRMILMNPAPASADDFQEFRKERTTNLGNDANKLNAIKAGAGYQKGDPEAVAAYYHILFQQAFAQPENLDKLIARLQASFANEGVLKARAVEAQLVDESWLLPSWNLLPQLKGLKIPTLVIYSDHDFIPVATPQHITQALPNARMVTLKDCGHFSYMECPDTLRQQVDLLFRGN